MLQRAVTSLALTLAALRENINMKVFILSTNGNAYPNICRFLIPDVF